MIKLRGSRLNLAVIILLLVLGQIASAQSCVARHSACTTTAFNNRRTCWIANGCNPNTGCGGFDGCRVQYGHDITQCNAQINNATYYVQAIQDVNELFCSGSGSGWSNGDVTSATGGPLAATNSALTGFFTSGTSHATYYVGTDQDIHELFWNGSAWSNGDVTAASGGVLAASGSPLASFNTTGPGHAVYYVGTNQHVYELYWTGSSWANGDVTAAAGGLSVSSGSGLTSFTTSGVGHAVYYVGTDQNVYELYWTGSIWANGNVTGATGATLAASNSALTSFVTASNTHATYYVSTDQHVHELFWNGSTWTTGDITAAASGALASSTGLATSTSPFAAHDVFYVSTNQHVSRLNWNGSAWINTDVTSAVGGVSVVSGGGLSNFDFFYGHLPECCGFAYVSTDYLLVYYVGTDQNVYELSWNGSSWAKANLTSTLASSASGLTSWVSH